MTNIKKDLSDNYIAILIAISLGIFTAVTYIQVKDCEFINLDDDYYITSNNNVLSGLTAENIRWSFSFTDKNYWHPLTWISHMSDVQLWGLDAVKHHLTNLFIHILNTLLLFYLLRNMTGSLWRSAFVAALFALHPINVDSVAWIAERKNLLSTFFWILAMLAYIFYTKRPSSIRYVIVIIAYVLGLLAKPMLITLPFVLLLLDYWPLNRIVYPEKSFRDLNAFPGMVNFLKSRVVLDKIPLVILSFISICISMFSLKQSDIVLSTQTIPLYLRISNAFVSLISYIRKIVLPYDLAIYYPFPLHIPIWQAAGAFFIILTVTCAILSLGRKHPYLPVGWFWYLITLSPVSGIYQAGLWPAMADRWAYVPSIGIFIMAAWGMPELFKKLRLDTKFILPALAVICLVLFMSVSWLQLAYWKNSRTLFEHNLRVTPENAMAHIILALSLIDERDFESAIAHCNESLRIKPDFYLPHLTMSTALFKQGKIDEAILHLETAIKINPRSASAFSDLGKCLFVKNKYDESLRQFRTCLKIEPRNGDAYKFIGNIMLSTEKYNEAIENYEHSLRINPHQAEVYYHLGMAYFHKNNYPKAIASFQGALQIIPYYYEATDYLNKARTAQATLVDQISSLIKSLQADPRNIPLHMKLANIYEQMGEYNSAISQYQYVLSLQPQNIPASYGLVRLYSERALYAQAISLLEKMKNMQPDNPDMYYNLACIYSKQNRKNEALSWLKISIEKGFKNWDQMKKDPDLDNIRNTQYVLELMKNH